MQKKLIIYIGILSLLFSCNNDKTIDSKKSTHFAFDTEKNEVLYKYYVGGDLVPSYNKLETDHPNDLVVLSENYATDGRLVFYRGDAIKNANPKGFIVDPNFPDFFAKDTISKIHYYENINLNLDFNSAKIYSKRYVLDKNKVLFNNGNYSDALFNEEIPVEDISSFEKVDKKSRNRSVLAKDKFWFYYNATKIPVPSKETQVISVSPVILLHKDTLHYVYATYKNIEKEAEKQLPGFKLINEGVIAETLKDTYRYFKISGLKNATQIDDSNWIKDDNGLYYMDFLYSLSNISKEQSKFYKYDAKLPNYLRTENNLFGVYYSKKGIFTSEAKILKEDIVIDNNTLFYEGEEIENVDIATLVTVNKNFLDKNYYYGSNSMKYRRPFPSWAYEGLKDGSIKFDEFSKSELTGEHEIDREYWNGFLVSVKVPTRMNTDHKLYIEFKNIERKTLILDTPLEDKMTLFFSSEYRVNTSYANDLSIKLTTTDTYNYKEIKPDETIKFTTELPEKVTDREGKLYDAPYFVTLSSINPPDKENYNEFNMVNEINFEE